jgi:hypothetical protein
MDHALRDYKHARYDLTHALEDLKHAKEAISFGDPAGGHFKKRPSFADRLRSRCGNLELRWG